MSYSLATKKRLNQHAHRPKEISAPGPIGIDNQGPIIQSDEMQCTGHSLMEDNYALNLVKEQW
jgi:hypothetical protein